MCVPRQCQKTDKVARAEDLNGFASLTAEQQATITAYWTRPPPKKRTREIAEAEAALVPASMTIEELKAAVADHGVTPPTDHKQVRLSVRVCPTPSECVIAGATRTPICHCATPNSTRIRPRPILRAARRAARGSSR